MKKKLLGLLCICILLSGCRVGSNLPIQTEPPVTEASTVDNPTTQPEGSYLPLLEQGSVLEESSNLLRIPNETVQRMETPEMRLLGNGLLLSEYRDQAMLLNHISLEDGILIASGSVPAGAGTKVYIGSGEIGLCDRESGLISILDEGFRVLRTYSVSTAGDDWYLNPELDTLYILFSDRGLLVRNLESGAENWLVDNGFRVAAIGGGSSYLMVTYTDRADQKTYTRCVNLSTATLETLPIGGRISGGTRQGENWLFQSDDGHVLVQGDRLWSVEWDSSDVRLLSPRYHLLAMDPSRRDLSLYDTNGGFLSRCSLPQNAQAITGSDFVWSGYWEGYFFTDFWNGSCRLMFWDVGADTEGENLKLEALGAAEQSEPVVEPQLYERANELSQRFGVDIRIAEQCSMDYTHYNTYIMNDPQRIRAVLDMLEDALSQYPDGFFRQLHYGSVESIRFEVAGTLMLKDGVEDHQDSAVAFAQNKGSYYLVALDGFMVHTGTLYHEISHIIDRRLEWDALLREDALYSEEAWLALQPKGFEYAMSYVDKNQTEIDLNYFVSDYSMTFPTEDRADLMREAMGGSEWAFEPGSGQRAKMQFYADCIRDCFNTTGWPETTSWEQVLK